MRLKRLIIADPDPASAKHLARHCEGLAEERVAVFTGSAAVGEIDALAAEMMIISCEIQRPDVFHTVREARRACPEMFIVATFRELAVPGVTQVQALPVDQLLADPIDLAALYGGASRHFGVPFRRH